MVEKLDDFDNLFKFKKEKLLKSLASEDASVLAEDIKDSDFDLNEGRTMSG